MSMLKGITGFLVGGVVGISALATVSLFMPNGQVTDPVATTVTKAADQEPTVVQDTETAAVVGTPEVETAISEPELPDIVEINPEVTNAEPDGNMVEEPKIVPPAIVETIEKSEVAAPTKKIKLPTVEPEEPVVETGISIGKKPNSSLPSITEEVPQEAENQEDADAQLSAAQQAGNALEFNAVDFKAEVGQPLMAVILRDIGDKGLTIEILQKLGMPVTIAILSNDPNASERALAYNAAGFEVIAMHADDATTALNTAQNDPQVIDALDVMFNIVPNAIGLLDSAGAKIQKNNRISKSIVKNFVTTGHGLVTYAKGLNPTDRIATSLGVRSAKVARVLDANAEDKTQMTRYLDRASLDAGRDGAVIILGTTAKNTIAAVAAWLLSTKGRSVEIAPVSAVLLRE